MSSDAWVIHMDDLRSHRKYSVVHFLGKDASIPYPIDSVFTGDIEDYNRHRIDMALNRTHRDRKSGEYYITLEKWLTLVCRK